MSQITGRVVLDVRGYYEFSKKQPVLSTEYPIYPIGTMSHISLSDEELMLLPDTIPGYSCAKRSLQRFKVNKLTSPKFRDAAWEDLRVPDETKDCIMRLVRNHRPPLNNSDTKNERQTLQKGFGLIFLLHGPPGTGKTLTAGIFTLLDQSPLQWR